MGAALHWKWFVRERDGQTQQQGEDDDADPDYAYPSLVSHVTCMICLKIIGLHVSETLPSRPCTCNGLWQTSLACHYCITASLTKFNALLS